MACKSLNPNNKFGFLRMRRVTGGTLADLPINDFCPVILVVSPPTSLVATVSSSTIINLAWTKSTYPSVTSQTLQISTSADFTTGVTEVTGIAAGDESYSATGLDADTTYYFRIKAISGAQESAWSDAASALTSYDLGRAINFDGVNDYISLSNLTGVSVDPDKFGFSIWVKIPTGFNSASIEPNKTVFGSSQANGLTKLVFIGLEKNNTVSWRFDCRLYDDSGAFKRDIRVSGIPYGTYPDGSIVHICGFGLSDQTSASGFDRQQIWINGVAINPASIANDNVTWLTSFGNTNYMGADRLARYYNDLIGDVVIFGGISLSDQDALYLYGGGKLLAGNPQDIIPIGNMYLWHKYNEDPITTNCIDSSGNSITGTLTNFAGGGDATERPIF